MAVMVKVETDAGETRELYVRVNSVERVANHGAPCVALFRGYISREASDARKAFVWEKTIEFVPDITKPLWNQAYAALLVRDLTPLEAELETGQAMLAEAEEKAAAAARTAQAVAEAGQEAQAEHMQSIAQAAAAHHAAIAEGVKTTAARLEAARGEAATFAKAKNV